MRNALVFAALLSAASCQCKSKATGEVAGSGSGSGSQPVKPPKDKSTLDIKLPALSGKPPVKTTAPIAKAQLDKLVELRFEDFDIEVNPYPIRVAIRQRAKGKPRMSVNISVSPCTEIFKCRAMTVDAWKADEAALKKELVDKDLVDRPDSTFEIVPMTIGGAPAIGIYQAGQFFGKDEDTGNPVGSYSNAYTLFYNDGVNFLRVSASFADNPMKSLADMTRALPRQFLEKAALAFLDAYGQAWN